MRRGLILLGCALLAAVVSLDGQYLIIRGTGTGGLALPPGIPDPGFGLAETLPSTSSATRDGRCANWPAATSSGCYYVDRTSASPACSDSTNGTPNAPRCTVPTASLGADAYVEVRGTGYTLGGSTTWTFAGTSGHPAIIRGVGSPQFTGSQSTINLRGSYAILDGLHLTNTKLRWGLSTTADADHLSVRNNEIEGWTGTASTSIIGNNAGLNGHAYLVVYNNTIHDNAYGVDQDIHGMLVGCAPLGGTAAGPHHVWYLNNTSYHNEGDTIQVGSASNCTDTALQPSYVYIGGNTCHDDGENCVDIKASHEIIVSQNTAYSYVPSGGGQASAGEAIVFHNNPSNVWILFNTVHDATIGIIGTGQGNAYILGNVVYAVACQPAQCTYTSLQRPGSAIDVDTQLAGTTTYVVGNTIRDSDRGINCESVPNGCLIVNNIIADPRQDSYAIGIETDTINSNTTVEDNLIFYPAGYVRFNVAGTTTYTTTTGAGSYTAAYPTKCSGCVEGDPLFVTAAGNANLALQSGSPAADTGQAYTGPYTTFQTAYTLSIQVDRLGIARPQNGLWDMGAYERVP